MHEYEAALPATYKKWDSEEERQSKRGWAAMNRVKQGKAALLALLASVVLVGSMVTLLKQKQFLQKKSQQPVLMQYYQTFPIERYPGLKCYVIATEERLLVSTQNCDIVLVQKENITINNIVILIF